MGNLFTRLRKTLNVWLFNECSYCSGRTFHWGDGTYCCSSCGERQ